MYTGLNYAERESYTGLNYTFSAKHRSALVRVWAAVKAHGRSHRVEFWLITHCQLTNTEFKPTCKLKHTVLVVALAVNATASTIHAHSAGIP